MYYLSYGSNLDQARFTAYIVGGSVPGSTKTHEGCRDRTLPRKRVHYKFAMRVRFVAFAEWWGGLAACCDDSADESSSHSHGVAYLITREQFLDVMRQENSLSLDHPVAIDWEILHKEKRLDVLAGHAYGSLRLVGDLETRPVYTFTHCDAFLKRQLQEGHKKPERTASVAYLNVIARGLSTHLTREELFDYLKTRDGIAGRWTDEALRRLVNTHYG